MAHQGMLLSLLTVCTMLAVPADRPDTDQLGSPHKSLTGLVPKPSLDTSQGRLHISEQYVRFHHAAHLRELLQKCPGKDLADILLGVPCC